MSLWKKRINFEKKSIKKAITEMGGEVLGEGVILNIKELNNNKQLFSLIDINED